jgi:hypothetical protein
MFTDETKIKLKYPGSAISRSKWVKQGQRWCALIARRPVAVCFYAGITKWGVTQPIFVTGTTNQPSKYCTQMGQTSSSITLHEYDEKVMPRLLGEGDRMFKEKGCSLWYYQQDGARPHGHAAANITKWNTRHAVKARLLANWPPSSPDLSPIENLWAKVKADVAAKGCKNVDEVKHAVVHVLASIKTETLAPLFASMHGRMAAVIKAAGDKINY